MADQRPDLFLGVFREQDHTLEATKACREAGFTFYDVFAPYAVHGLDRAMGLPFSKITWVTFLCGAMGCIIAISGMTYVSAWDWPLNIGGKAPFPFPAFVPVMFELMVLSAGVGVVLTFLIARRLGPWRTPDIVDPRVTHDRFVLVLDAGASDPRVVRRLFADHRAVAFEERDMEGRP